MREANTAKSGYARGASETNPEIIREFAVY